MVKGYNLFSLMRSGTWIMSQNRNRTIDLRDPKKESGTRTNVLQFETEGEIYNYHKIL